MMRPADAGDRNALDTVSQRPSVREIQHLANHALGSSPPIVPFWRTGRRLVALGALLVAAIFGAVGLLIAANHAAYLQESQRGTEDVAQVLAEQTSRTIRPVDLALREVAAKLTASEPPGHVSRWRTKGTFDLLAEQKKGLPQVDALLVVDADGHEASISRLYPADPLDVSSRDYYRYLQAHDDPALFASAPAKSLRDGRWMVFLARRINGSDGTFAGIVVAAVSMSYLEDFYRVVTPANAAVTVLRRDGVILLRYPVIEQLIGVAIPSQSPWHKFIETGGSFASPGYLGNVANLVSVRPLRNFPLVIDVSTTRAAALAGWRRQTLWLLAGAALLAACVVFLLRVFSMQYSRLTSQNAQLETGRQQFDAVLENISQGLTFFDAEQKLMVSNRRYAEIYRLTPDQSRPGSLLADIIGFRIAAGSFPDMTTAAYLERRKALTESGESFDVIDEFRDGRSVSMHYRPLPNGGWVVTHEDITDRCRAEAALAFLARHDALTQLPNRTLFQERLLQAIAQTRDGAYCALLCLDLDRFKPINDTLGHPVGDGLLRAVAGRLLSAVREGDTVARLGGDEFAIIQVGLKTPESAATLADRIIAAVHDPFDIDGHRIAAGVSIGISIAPTDGLLPDILLTNADIALYLAKAEGRGTHRFFEPAIDLHLQQRRAVELDLRKALAAEEFALHYQPILDLASGRVSGFEALIRWNHPTRGIVHPVDFMAIAEESGLVAPICEWALRTACLEAARWPDDIEIAVNLSAFQFNGGHLLDVVKKALAASKLAPNRLELEITESLLLERDGDGLALLHQLGALGIRISLDDLGTGYSSLSYLRSFPFNKIKIDQSFIHDVETNRESAAVVAAIVGLGRSLGMTTVAEGVENWHQLTVVKEQNCARAQGYLFSHPCVASDVPGLIRNLLVPNGLAPGFEPTAGLSRETASSDLSCAAGRRDRADALDTFSA